MYHMSIIRKYTAALLDMFNELEVQYKDTNGNIRSNNVPITFNVKEKSHILDNYSVEQIQSGNYNVLPRGFLSLTSIQRNSERTTNKNVKINTIKNENTFDFQYNAVPYDIMFDITVKCRGMNEATMIIEQVLPLFNPVYNIDVYEIDSLDEPTRLPVSLLDVSIEKDSDYEELYQNLINVNFGLLIKGNFYPPIKSIERIKEYKLQIFDNRNETVKKSLMSWDINEDGSPINEEIVIPEIANRIPHIIDIIVDGNLQVGDNNLEVLYTDEDSIITELTFTWSVLSGNAIITGNKELSSLKVNSAGDIEIMVEIKDKENNYNSLIKVFTI